MHHPLILASASPQRSKLLEQIDVPFEVHPSAVDETACTEGNPTARALHLCELKARDRAAHHPDRWILGADTLVEAHDGTLLEKPADADGARWMLGLHSGKTSAVHSALCLISPSGDVHKRLHSSQVTFRELQQRDIEWWIDTNLWQGRSGGFQIDGKGQLLIAHIEGDWTAIVGLPVFAFGELCEEAGLDIRM